MTTSNTSIWEEARAIEKARRDRMSELMREYDLNVYNPAIKAVQERCIAEHGGHIKTKWHDNGLGWYWWYCGRCGATHNKGRTY